eukprot:INCI10749.1.p1 GENE.INCI10749.1~~INCI10749.1.p1  ORF type:complete len:461 (+),score=40.54 INCI10749.1:156-1538(+)
MLKSLKIPSCLLAAAAATLVVSASESSGVAQSTPSAFFSCKSDLDCQLNGICESSSGECACDPAWGGADCGDLQLEPGTIAYGCLPEEYTGAAPTCNITSWGGGPPVRDPATGKWIMFVTEMAANCGLSVWQWMSTIVRASADSPEGPYTREELVIGAESHNAYYVQEPLSGKHLIFHIGTGENGTEPWINNCTNGTTPFPQYYENVLFASETGRENETLASVSPEKKRKVSGLHLSVASISPIGPAGDDYSPSIHEASELNGSFSPVAVKGTSQMNRGASNPAPFFFANGSALVLFRLYNSTPAKHTSRIFAMTAPSYDGPYEVRGEVFHPAGYPVFNDSSATHVNEEDPCIWRDTRGNFHNLDHFTHGHGFSEDGLTWHWADPTARGRPAWRSTLKLANGTVVDIGDAERPRVWVNPDTGSPELFFVASGGNRQPTIADGHARGFTMVQRIHASSKPQ